MSRPLASRLLSAVFFLLACLAPLPGQEEESSPLTAEEKLIQALFASEDPKALQANIAAAEKGGIARQAVLEARFLFLVEQQDFAAVAALAPTLEKQQAQFRIEDSVIFSVPEEFAAIIQYCHALAALEKDDHTLFKKHITEAFWLSPRQAAAFAPHIDRLRLDQAMAKLTVDFEQQFRQQADATKASLASLANNSRHVVLHFWSPWSTECEANLPDFLAMTGELVRNEVPVVSILIEPGSEALQMARKFRADIKSKEAGAWIVDNSEDSLAHSLRVQDIPTVALLCIDGSVLFNGHPADAALWDALRKVAPAIKRPPRQPLD